MARQRVSVPGLGTPGDQPQVRIGRWTKARQRLFEYGPSVGIQAPGVIPRITTSDVRSGIPFGTKRRRVDPAVRLGLAETNKSILRRKIKKGMRQPGRSAPNYKSPMD